LSKKNCWEFKKCGRQAGGDKVKELGTCPVSVEHRLHGVHEGDCAGRACWIVAGSYCDGKEQGSFAQKYHNCEICDFYQLVRREEGLKFKLSSLLLARLKGSPASGAGATRR
jgi:hypothetical protein